MELNSFFSNIIYLWTTALDFPNVLGFQAFLDLFPFLAMWVFFFFFWYTSSVIGLCVFTLFNEISITYKKKLRNYNIIPVTMMIVLESW